MLPVCGIPRPGDRVCLYQDTLRVTGQLLGHRPDGAPIINNDFGSTSVPRSFDCIRLVDPGQRIGPNWERLPPSGRLYRPASSVRDRFRQLLDQRTPPGPKYMDLVEEVRARGFEVYLVGGSVRDTLSGETTHDVDLVTTMPLVRALPLIRTMYRRPDKLEDGAARNGHLRLGGAPGTADPFIDLCVFKYALVGSRDAVFASDFERDVCHRDFACNAVYYDPVNDVLVDPTGTGVADAISRTLSFVYDSTLRSPHNIGTIMIRFFKFMSRGYVAHEACGTRVSAVLVSALAAIPESIRATYIRTQILSKAPQKDHHQHFEAFREQFVLFGVKEVWERYVEPLRKDILI